MNRETLDRYREAIVQTAEAEKALIDCRARLAIIDKEIELNGKVPSIHADNFSEGAIVLYASASVGLNSL